MNDRTIFGKAVWLFFAKAKEKQRNRTSKRFSCFTFAFAPTHNDRSFFNFGFSNYLFHKLPNQL